MNNFENELKELVEKYYGDKAQYVIIGEIELDGMPIFERNIKSTRHLLGAIDVAKHAVLVTSCNVSKELF